MMQEITRQAGNSAVSKKEDLLMRAHSKWEAGKLRSAFQLFLIAAKMGDVTAQLNLGYFYDLGLGVKPNASEALRWYKRAYRQGQASAATNVGTIFRDQGNPKRAIAWFERGVELGDVEANLEIAKVLLSEKKHSAEIVRYLKRVVAGKPGIDVTIAGREEANRLLKILSRRQAPGGNRVSTAKVKKRHSNQRAAR